jgi:GNAT superfamily N-acetyltransferase
MTAPRLRPPGTGADWDAIADLCRDYRRFLFEANPPARAMLEGFYPEAAYEALMADLPRLHVAPEGFALLAEADGRAVGCGMFRRHDAARVEIKRVYVAPDGRGTGLGRAIMAGLLAEARARGNAGVLLDTMHVLRPAATLYEALGFTRRGPYLDGHAGTEDVVRCYELTF